MPNIHNQNKKKQELMLTTNTLLWDIRNNYDAYRDHIVEQGEDNLFYARSTILESTCITLLIIEERGKVAKIKAIKFDLEKN